MSAQYDPIQWVIILLKQMAEDPNARPEESDASHTGSGAMLQLSDDDLWREFREQRRLADDKYSKLKEKLRADSLHAQLFERLDPELKNYIFSKIKSASEEDKEDILANTWKNVLSGQSEYLSIRAVLFSTARNLCSNYLRDKKDSEPLAGDNAERLEVEISTMSKALSGGGAPSPDDKATAEDLYKVLQSIPHVLCLVWCYKHGFDPVNLRPTVEGMLQSFEERTDEQLAEKMNFPLNATISWREEADQLVEDEFNSR